MEEKSQASTSWRPRHHADPVRGSEMKKQRQGRYLPGQRDWRAPPECWLQDLPDPISLAPVARLFPKNTQGEGRGLKVCSFMLQTLLGRRWHFWEPQRNQRMKNLGLHRSLLRRLCFSFLTSSPVGAGSGCWRGEQRGQAALLPHAEILIKVRLKAAPAVHIARARWMAAQQRSPDLPSTSSFGVEGNHREMWI